MRFNFKFNSMFSSRVSSFMTHGYRTRRLAVDYSIPLITDVKCTKLLVESMRLTGRRPAMKTHTDCMTSRRLITLPGFIDVHVHFREPGDTHKEDFSTGTAAALAGGVTMVCAMPNTKPAIVDADTLKQFQVLAKAGARCDYALYMGATDTNWTNVHEFIHEIASLKMYLNNTFGTLKINDTILGLENHMQKWPKNAVPIVCHAEGQTVATVILMAYLLDRPVHICHISRKEDIILIKNAKEKGIRITCEVCPHHLFLTSDDISSIGGSRCAEVRPMLVSMEDQEALWDNIDIIDIFATDHAPHTWEEKNSEISPPGYPGLETILPLLLKAVHDGRLTLDDIKNKFYHNPKKIFNLPDQPNTYVEVDLDEEWTISKEYMHSKSKWTPFEGWRVKGRVHRVVLRGEVAFIDGEILVQPGYGQNVRHQTGKCKPEELTGEMSKVTTHVNEKSYKLFGQKEDILTDSQANEVFSRLLSDTNPIKQNVHFNGDPNTLMQKISTSQFGGRLRCDSSSNVNLRDFLCKTSSSNQSATMHINQSLFGRHVVSVNMFSKDQLNDIFNLAQMLRSRVTKDRPVDDLLKGKIMASIFYEVSTRTSCSFASAMQRLGGHVIHVDATSSSVQKGESLEDSVTVLAGYSDLLVIRHPEPGAIAVSICYYLLLFAILVSKLYFYI